MDMDMMYSNKSHPWIPSTMLFDEKSP